MRAFLLAVSFCILTAGPLLAGEITPENAGKHVGEKVTVRGVVIQAVYSPGLGKAGQAPNIKNKNAYLNFGAKFPDQVFSVAVLSAKTPALLANGPGWLTELQGREVSVTGTVELHEGKPEIVLSAREDLNASPVK